MKDAMPDSSTLMLDFKDLLTEYQDRVYNQAYRMLGNREDAEEAVQDIFLKIYHSAGSFRGDSKVSTWIYRITANECISRLRKKQLQTSSLHEPLGEGGPTLADIIPDTSKRSDSLLEDAETAEMIRNEVHNLQPEWAMAISLCHFDDLSYDEIADVMDLPRATVGTYIYRGRRELAHRLAGCMSG